MFPRTLIAIALLLLPLSAVQAVDLPGCEIAPLNVTPTGVVPSGPTTLIASWTQTGKDCSATPLCTFTVDGASVAPSSCVHPGVCDPGVACFPTSSADLSVSPGLHTVKATYCYTYTPGGVCITAQGSVSWAFFATGCGDVSPGVAVVACAAPTGPAQVIDVPSLVVTPGASHHVAGYVDDYRFAAPGGGSLNVPCVTLAADGAETDACAAAGGAFVARVATLLDQPVQEETVSEGPVVASVHVCSAALTATVLGFGASQVPIYTVC